MNSDWQNDERSGLMLQRSCGAFWRSLLLVLLCFGCRASDSHTAVQHASFIDDTTGSGIDFVHTNGASGHYFYPELLQGGLALLDADNDGFLDVYLVQSGNLPPAATPEARNRLYRNNGDSTFTEITESAGVGDAGYGSGAVAADFDADGWVDLYVTNLGHNRLYRNNGDGTFNDVTERAGVGDDGYSTSALFVDVDGDLDLDLYVANYLEWAPHLERRCLGPNGQRGYCSPSEYAPSQDHLYRNDGDGTFTDVSATAGIAPAASTGLGVVAADFDGNGWVDLYVANDQRPNTLWMNQGDGQFRDEALIRGAALSGDGLPEAGMGVVVEDPDNDGDWDLFVVHLSGETNTFYRNEGGGQFYDVTDSLRLGTVSQPYTGFGTVFADFDRDGTLDLFIANGKVLPGDTVEIDYREPNQLLRGLRSGSFENVTQEAGSALSPLEVSRGVAAGDYDNDGDLDLFLVNNGGPMRLLRNEAPRENHWLGVELVGDRLDRTVIGAVIEVTADGITQRRQTQPAYGYCTSHDPRVFFGLADQTVVDVVVHWPDGFVQELVGVDTNQLLELDERSRGEKNDS